MWESLTVELYCLFFQGHKRYLTDDIENKIPASIQKMLDCHFGPTLVEFIDLVQEFITLRDYQTQFKNNRPS